MTAESEVTLKQALAYASHGWPVFPAGQAAGARHQAWFHDGTTDPAQINQWWTHQPAANLAIATGLPGRTSWTSTSAARRAVDSPLTADSFGRAYSPESAR